MEKRSATMKIKQQQFRDFFCMGFSIEMTFVAQKFPDSAMIF